MRAVVYGKKWRLSYIPAADCACACALVLPLASSCQRPGSVCRHAVAPQACSRSRSVSRKQRRANANSKALCAGATLMKEKQGYTPFRESRCSHSSPLVSGTKNPPGEFCRFFWGPCEGKVRQARKFTRGAYTHNLMPVYFTLLYFTLLHFTSLYSTLLYFVDSELFLL